LKTTEDSFKVACEIYKILKEIVLSEDKKDEKKKDGKKKDGNPDQKKKDGKKSKCKCDGENKGPGESSKKPKDPGGKTPKDDGSKAKGKTLKDKAKKKAKPLSTAELKRLLKAIQKQKEFNSGEIKKIGKLSKKDGRIVKTLKESGTEAVPVETAKGQPDPVPVDTIVIKKMTPAVVLSMEKLFDTYRADRIINSRKNWKDSEDWGHDQIKEMDEAVQRGIVLGKQLGKKLHLRNENKSLKSTRLKSGKIDRRLISQLGFNNASVFHRIITDSYKNFFIHISIDASGSMSGKRLQNAVKSAVAVAQAASMTTGIRVQISLRGTASLEGDKGKTITLYAYDSAEDKMGKIKTWFKFLQTFGITPEGIAFESIFKDIKKDAKGDECIFINYSDGMPSNIWGCHWGYCGVEFTKNAVKRMREIGINVISYFIDGSNSGYSADRFKRMYGPDSEFIDTSNMTKVSKSMNRKFLEISDN